jgi:catechol 2,3-dioxygenase-like lactoylglutathione lyase family enzyme
VGENGRWQLTDLQRFLVILTVVLALFIAAMALGSASVVLLLVAAFLLVLSGLAVFLLGLRHNGRKAVQGSGYVITVARPPVDNIQGRCDMRMRVNLPGRPSVDLKVRAPAVPVTRWPVVGQTLPIEAPQNNPRQVRVRWDLVELGYVRAPEVTPPRQSTGSPLDAIPETAPYPQTPPVHVFTEFADAAARSESPSESRSEGQSEGGPDGGSTLRLEPTPVAFDPASFDPGFDDDYITPPGMPRQIRPGTPEQDDYLDFEFEGPLNEAPTERTIGPPAVEDAPPAAMEPARAPEPDDGAVITPSWEVDPLPGRQPAADEPGQTSAEASGAASGDGPVRNIPLPRDAEEPSIRFLNADRHDSDTPAMGGMLIVSDLDRSLRFYSDLLGFTIVYASAGNAVVEYGGARILLQHMADFSSIDRRVGHLHIEVPDLDAAYADLAAKGVQFSHRPRMVSRGDEIELWKATFRDPDGHGIALTEWRHRDIG